MKKKWQLELKQERAKEKLTYTLSPCFALVQSSNSVCCLNVVLHKTCITRDRLLNSRRNAGISIIQMSSSFAVDGRHT